MSPTPEQTMPSPTRRRLIGAAAASVAVTAGALVWLNRPRPSTPIAPSKPAGEPAPADLWSQQFDTPTGGTLKLADYRGHPLVLNFWATWCPPCVKELPELNHFHEAFHAKGWRVVGLAIDGPTPVREFLAKVGVGFDIGLAGFGGTELSQKLGNAAGGLPFSVILDAQGQIRHRITGATSYDALSAQAALIDAPAPR
ncbi:TlpA family protein disulfide reductase [Aquabacterium sp.]|uniref:TlpA family protein disulfide reductase n=1 Tax=Aquabacterium sp. TaxID=1872578 RepID=UPI003B6C69B3